MGQHRKPCHGRRSRGAVVKAPRRVTTHRTPLRCPQTAQAQRAWPPVTLAIQARGKTSATRRNGDLTPCYSQQLRPSTPLFRSKRTDLPSLTLSSPLANAGFETDTQRHRTGLATATQLDLSPTDLRPGEAVFTQTRPSRHENYRRFLKTTTTHQTRGFYRFGLR